MYQPVSPARASNGRTRTAPLKVVATVLTAAFFRAAGASAASATIDQSHTFDSWSQFATGGTDVTVTADTDIPHRGSAAVKHG